MQLRADTAGGASFLIFKSALARSGVPVRVCECVHGWEEEVSVADKNAGTTASKGGGGSGRQDAFCPP